MNFMFAEAPRFSIKIRECKKNILSIHTKAARFERCGFLQFQTAFLGI